MGKLEDQKALLEIYLYADLDDEEALDNYLKEANIDADKFSEKIAEQLRHKKAELMLQQGRKFKERYEELKKVLYKEETENNFKNAGEAEFAVAYRKQKEEEPASEEEELKILELIKKAKEKN